MKFVRIGPLPFISKTYKKTCQKIVQWSPLHGYCKETLTVNTCMDIQTIPSYRHLAAIQAEWIVSIQVNFKNGSESWSLWRQMRFPFSTINDNIYIYYVGVLQ